MMNKRNIGNEILQALQDIKDGKGHKRKLDVDAYSSDLIPADESSYNSPAAP